MREPRKGRAAKKAAEQRARTSASDAALPPAGSGGAAEEAAEESAAAASAEEEQQRWEALPDAVFAAVLDRLDGGGVRCGWAAALFGGAGNLHQLLS